MGTKESGLIARWKNNWAARQQVREESRASKLAFREEMGRRLRSLRDVAAEDKILEKMSEKRKEAFWNMTYEQRSAFLSYAVLEQRVKRRTLLGAGIAAAIASAVVSFDALQAVDQQSLEDQKAHLLKENGIYGNTHLEILDICKDWFPAKEGEQKPSEVFVTTAGIGILNSLDAARTMGIEGLRLQDENKDEKDKPMTYLITSVEGKKIHEIADVLLEASKMGDGLSLYGQSNGGVVLLEALNYLKNERNITLPVKRLILNCSPFDFTDARDNFLEGLLARLLIVSGYEPGEIGTFLFQLKDSPEERANFYESLLKRIDEAWDAAKNTSPASPWVADLRILIQSRLRDHNFTGVITKDTEVLLLRSNYDGVVHDRDAIEKYKEKFGPDGCGAKITVETLPDNAGHADVTAAGKAAHPWLNRTNFALAA